MGTACSIDRTAAKDQAFADVKPVLGPLLSGVAQGRQARLWKTRYEDEVNSGPNIPPEDAPFPIEIQGLKANNLNSSDLDGFADPYCVVSLRDPSKAVLATKKTETIKRTKNPTWRTNIRFPLSAVGANGSLVGYSLKFEIFDWDRGSTPDLLGQYVVDLDSLKSPHNGLIEGDLVSGQGQKKSASGSVNFNLTYEEGMQAEPEPTEADREKARAELEKLNPWFGLHLKPTSLIVTVADPPIYASPRLMPDDQIIMTNGVKTSNTQEFGKVAGKLTAGQKVHVQFTRERRTGTSPDGTPLMSKITLNTVIELGATINKKDILPVSEVRALRKRAGLPWQTDREVITKSLAMLEE